MTYGAGQYRYELQPHWAKMPRGRAFVDVSGLAVDPADNVYVFSRSDHPIMVFDREGTFLLGWGEGHFNRPHSIKVASDGTVWCTDDGNQTVSAFTSDGRLIGQFGGEHGVSGIGRITGIAVAPNGDVVVGDTNAERIVRFDADGNFLSASGSEGTGPGQFRDPHDFWFDAAGRLLVVDRDNNRIQVFGEDNDLLGQLTDVDRPTAVFVDGRGDIYVSEGHQRVSVFAPDGRLLSRFGSQGEDKATALFHTPHAIVVNSEQTIFVGENRHGLGDSDAPARALQAFVRLENQEDQSTPGRTNNVISA
ncbi:MAG TPA: 6-bladed beta-propeller [Devosia sp.]|nr:6-bladed beta-propeller [Devosia sp.]